MSAYYKLSIIVPTRVCVCVCGPCWRAGGPGDQNGMDCADIVIGAAVGELSRVGDYYTSDRSTPRHDEFYGGSQSLTAAIASQDADGMTTVIFRRSLAGVYQVQFIVVVA